MIVYKYLPAEFGIRAILDERLKVGIANLQNDIFDCYPIIQAGSLPDDQEDRKLTEETLKQMAASYGIVSFCEKADKLLLWAHYGDSHRGLALGIEFSDRNEPLKVQYLADDERLVVRKDEIESVANGDPDKRHSALFQHAFNVKGKDWEYEGESRHFVELGKCEKLNGLYFVSLSRAEIREVILGARCAVTTEDVWRAFRNGTGSKFTIFHARPGERELKMNLVPYEVQPNESWFWSYR